MNYRTKELAEYSLKTFQDIVETICHDCTQKDAQQCVDQRNVAIEDRPDLCAKILPAQQTIRAIREDLAYFNALPH